MNVRNFLGLHFIWDSLGEALWALRDNRLRTVLSIMGISVGIAAVMAVGTVSKGGHFLIFRELETFGLKSFWIFRAPEEKDPHRAIRKGTGIETIDYHAVEAGCCPQVRRISPVVMEWARQPIVRVGNQYSNVPVSGIGFEFLDINNDLLTLGRPFEKEDEIKSRPVAILGPTVQADLFGAHENPIGKEILIGENKYTVVGLLKAKSRDFLASIGSAGGQDANNRILIPFTAYQQQLGTHNDINYFQGETMGLEVTDLAVSEVINILQRNHNSKYSYKSETMAQYIVTSNRILQGVSLIGVIAASVSLLVGGMGIMNIMSTSVLERTREIGLRKAVGARRRDILIQFLMEATLISTIGGLLGLTLGAVASYGLALWTGFPLTPSWFMVGVALVVSVGVGIISGYYPARRAASLRPVEALRYE